MSAKQLTRIGIALLIVVVFGSWWFFTQNKQETPPPPTDFAEATRDAQLTDARRFAQLYPGVGEDNVFVFRDGPEIIEILKHGTGIVFFGFEECPWCQAYLPILNTLAKETGIEKIYYFKILDDRANNTPIYQEIVSLLGDNLDYDEEGKPRIFVPDITFVKEGQIIGHNNDTSMNSADENGPPEEYWTPELIADLRLKLREPMLQVLPEDCGASCDM